MLKANLPDGAYYLAGYSVECALKARIAKSTERHDFPDKVRAIASYTHDLNELVIVAKLKFDRIEQAKLDPIFKSNWDVVGQWSEETRYHRNDSQAAQALIDAIADKKHGVMTWIRQHW